MRINRRLLYFPAITLTALTFTLTVILAISTFRNLRREQQRLEESLMREGLALLRLFEAATHSGQQDFPEEVVQVQQLATVVAPNEDVAYIYLFDQQGKILAHTDEKRVGQQIDGRLPEGEEILKIRRDQTPEHLFEIRGQFHPIDPWSSSEKRTTVGAVREPPLSIDHYLAIGLKMNDLEQAHLGDRQHTMMMAAMMILLGSGSLFFILVAQNFYLIQRALSQMKSYIHYVVESMANGLISLDGDGVATTINRTAAELTGVVEIRAKPLSIDEVFPEHAHEIRRVLLSDHVILNKEIAYQRPDSSTIPLSLSATQVKDERGNKLGVVVLLQDLREIKELQERARRAEYLASIGRMAATVAHEIRNPLSTIRGFAQYFAALFSEEKEERIYALTMMEESNRLNRVVSELLNYARPLELKLESFSIETLFRDAIQRIRLEKEVKNIEFIQGVPSDMPFVRLDRDRMLQVLLNLTQNSIDAMPDGGRISFSAAWLKPQRSVRIEVQDTGKDIPPHELSRLFEPFFTTKGRGTGLGLAIVRKIIDAHGGEVKVQSEENVGTKVILTLPQVSAECRM
jgi:two-component system sensor histidine kinase HydH